MTDKHYFQRRSHLDLLRADTWQIQSGLVRATTWMEDGSLTTLGFWGAGEIVGNACLGAENYRLECLTPVLATPFLSESYLERAMLAHIQQLQELLIIRSCKRIEDKVLQLLTWLGRRFGSTEEVGITLDTFLTHQDLAEALCTTRVTITRSLKDLERQGTIRHLDNRRLFIDKSTSSQIDPPPQKLVENLAILTGESSLISIRVAAPRSNRPLSISHR